MPQVLDPNATMKPQKGKGKPLAHINHGYNYPDGLNLRPGHKKHQRLLDQILAYARDSYNTVSQRHKDWNEIDRVLKSYTYLPTTGGKNKKSRDEHNEQVDEMRRIVMPVSQVVLDTLLTYFTSAFIRNPIFTYEGTGPEDIYGAYMMTELVHQQSHKNAVPLSLHTAWRDMFSYGVGYASPRWKQTLGRKIELTPTGFFDNIASFFQTGSARRASDYQILYEGNVLDNIDPYLALPDPTVSAHEVQQGEYFGWIDEDTLSTLLRNEDSNGFFNVKYLRDLDAPLTSDLTNRGHRNDKRQTAHPSSSNPVDIIWMYIDLIPRDWELGRSDDPETWVFAVAADTVIIQAEPLNLAHGKIPVAAGAPDFDGYSITPMSRLMAIEEIQVLVDFLYTSHVENIRRVINDNLVVDPSLINIHDINNNKPGKIIRARKRAWGQGGLRDNAIFQLDVKDVTGGNVADAQFLMDQAKTATSTMDQLGGNLSPRTSRVSASEAQGLRLAGLSRLERPAQIVSHQFMLPIARMFASNVQQFMEQDTFVKATGELAQRLREEYGIEPERERVPVSPEEMLVNYDVMAHDGVVPGKENVQVWTELFQVMSQNPELAQHFDMQRIFTHIARQMGAPNVDGFVRQRPIEVLPDDEVVNEVDKGNLVPTNGQV